MPRKKKLKTLLKEVKNHLGCNETEIERALDIRPFGYLKKAVELKREPPGLRQLLMIIRAFPWMLKAADEGYHTVEAKKTFLTHAVDIIVENM